VDQVDGASCNCGIEHESENHVDIESPTKHRNHTSHWLTIEDQHGKVHRNLLALYVLFQLSPVLWPFHFFFPNFKSKGKVLLDNLFNHWHQHQEMKSEVKQNTRTFAKVRQRLTTKKFLKYTYKISTSLIMNFLAGFLIILSLSLVASNHGFYNFSKISADYREVTWALNMDQNWAMFSPRPPDVLWWYNFEATLDNGTKVDLFRDGGWLSHEPSPFTFDKPDPSNFVYGFKNHRWFKYFENGYNTHRSNSELRLSWGRWLCREYNSVHTGADRLYLFSIHFMSERVDTDKMDGTRYLLQKMTLWNHICYEK